MVGICWTTRFLPRYFYLLFFYVDPQTIWDDICWFSLLLEPPLGLVIRNFSWFYPFFLLNTSILLHASNKKDLTTWHLGHMHLVTLSSLCHCRVSLRHYFICFGTSNPNLNKPDILLKPSILFCSCSQISVSITLSPRDFENLTNSSFLFSDPTKFALHIFYLYNWHSQIN